MSFCVIVFDTGAAPDVPAAFADWERERTDWRARGEGALDPAGAGPAIEAWFMEMIRLFPPTDGPWSLPSWRNRRTWATYRFAGPLGLVAFPDELAEEGLIEVFEFARHHRLGIHEVGGYGEVWMPGPDGLHGIVMTVETTPPAGIGPEPREGMLGRLRRWVRPDPLEEAEAASPLEVVTYGHIAGARGGGGVRRSTVRPEPEVEEGGYVAGARGGGTIRRRSEPVPDTSARGHVAGARGGARGGRRVADAQPDSSGSPGDAVSDPGLTNGAAEA